MGNVLAHKCKRCKRSFNPTKIDQRYCSPRCRQAAYRNRQKSPLRAKRQAIQPILIPTTCLHCNGSFWAKRRTAQFCSTSCRTLHHKALKAAIPQALATIYGLPQEKAYDLLDTQPIAKVRRLLETAGYSYLHQIRSWVATSPG